MDRPIRHRQQPKVNIRHTDIMNKGITALILLTLGGITTIHAQDISKDPDGTSSTHTLNEVVVTATRTPKKISDSPVMTQVITARQIEQRGVSDIKTLLSQEIPGLVFNEVGFGTSINMQGLGGKHVLFLIDGERIAGETGDNIDYQRIDLNNIERIEIVQGAGSALYGSQAMGGVINIITKSPRKRLHVSLDTKWATPYDTNFRSVARDDKYRRFKQYVDKPNLNASLTVGYRSQKWASLTTLTHKSADAYNLYDTDSVVKYFPKYNRTVTKPVSTVPTQVAGYILSSLRQGVTFTPTTRLTLSATGSLYEMSKLDLTFDNKHEYNTDISGSLSGVYQLTGGGEVKASIYGDRYSRYHKYDLLQGEKGLIYKHDIYQPRVSYTQRVAEKHEVSAGLEYFNEELYADRFGGAGYSSRSQSTGALYIQDDWQATPRLGIVGGVRTDYHSAYGLNVSPKLAAIYKWLPMTFRLNYAAGYRSPTIKELYMNWDHLGMFMIYGNADLVPEHNHYISLSAEYSSKHFYAFVSGYVNNFSNKIEGIWTNEQKELHYRNTKSARLAGLQTQVRINPYIEGLQIHLSGNYLVPSRQDGVRLNTQSPLSGTLRAEYGHKWRKHTLNVNLIGSYIGTKEFDVSEKIDINGETVEAFYTARIPQFSLWHLTLSYKYDKLGYITLGVDNLFDYQAGVVSFNSYAGPGRNYFAALHIDI